MAYVNQIKIDGVLYDIVDEYSRKKVEEAISIVEKLGGAATDDSLGQIKSGGDIEISDEGVVTVKSVNGKKLGKDVPEDAVFTDTLYTLPKATKDKLGGVRVDDSSIKVDSNGVLYAAKAYGGSEETNNNEFSKHFRLF